MLCWAPCTYYWGPPYACSKYCTRTGLWLPFDYCDLAGSKVKNLRVISCIVKIWSNGDYIQFGIILWTISISLSHWTYWIFLIYWTSLTFSNFHPFRLFGHFGLLGSFRPFWFFELFLPFEQFRLLNLWVFYISWAFQNILNLWTFWIFWTKKTFPPFKY